MRFLYLFQFEANEFGSRFSTHFSWSISEEIGKVCVETTFNYSLRPLVASHHRHKQSSCHRHIDRKESNRHNRPFETHFSVGDIVIAIKYECSHRVVGLLSKLIMILVSFYCAFSFRPKACNLLIYILHREIKSRYGLRRSFAPRRLQLKILF